LPMTSYGGEGLEELVQGKEIQCPFSLWYKALQWLNNKSILVFFVHHDGKLIINGINQRMIIFLLKMQGYCVDINRKCHRLNNTVALSSTAKNKFLGVFFNVAEIVCDRTGMSKAQGRHHHILSGTPSRIWIERKRHTQKELAFYLLALEDV
jgi:hypothetical protein